MISQMIDINCMIGQWPSQKLRFCDSAGLLAAMDEYHITHCVAYHSDTHWDLRQGNDQMHQAAEQSGGRIRHAYVLRPNLDSAELPDGPTLLQKLRREKPVAIKMFPNQHRFLADSFYCGDLLEVLNELGMPVMFDPDQRPSYEALPKLAADFPRIRFILLRTAINESRYTLPLLKKTKNVFFDTSVMIDAGLIDEIVERFGSERLLFGSNQPFHVPAGALGMIFYGRFSDQHKQNILWNNWQQIERSIAW
jgi:predicted TIM-barrel fold metal-dependent hydrolase